jgi:hypothetical protein
VKSVSLRSVVFDLALPKQTFFQSANYVRTELPVRIAHRIRDLQALPYAVVMQEGVAKVYDVRYTVSRPTPQRDAAH